jgi:hypothetical protein
MFLIASVILPATALAAGSGTLSLSQSTISTTTGSTVSVDVNTQATTAMSGASAAVDFDNTKLQILSVAKGAAWDVAGITWVVPSVSDIATANSTGHMPAVAAYFTDGSSSLPAATPTKLATVTFFATASGSVVISLPVSGNQGGIIDGAAATYGSEVVTTSTGGTVTIAAGTGSGASTTATINGIVDSGYVSLTCPSSVAVPLVRNVTNLKDFTCTVGSNVTWTLSTKDNDANGAAYHGHMVDPSQVPIAQLASSLHVVSTTNNVDLAASPSASTIYASQNNAAVPLTFSQAVAAQDKPGSYGMSVLFSITSTF